MAQATAAFLGDTETPTVTADGDRASIVAGELVLSALGLQYATS
jgi:hypothetical protein